LKNPIIFFLFYVFAFVNVLDIFTAFFIEAGETNPLYLLIGNFWILIILKIGIVLFLGYIVKRNIYPSNFMYYMIMMLLVLGTLLISIGVWSNIYGMLNPEVIAQGAAMSSKEKIQGYTLFVSVIYIIPAIFNLLSFWLYDKSVKKARIDKEYFKNQPWWHP